MSKQKPVVIRVPGPGEVATTSNIESFQEQAERKSVRKEAVPPKPMTEQDAIQEVLARADLPPGWHAGHTEVEAVRILVKNGWSQEGAERAVRAALY